MKRIAIILSVVVSLLLATSSCDGNQFNAWRAARGLKPLSGAELDKALEGINALVAEIDRRKSFVGEILPVDAARLGLTWHEGCPVAPSDLRLLKLSFWGPDGVAHHEGELIVNKQIAEKMVAVFRTLFNEKFMINRMDTPDKYVRPDQFDSNGMLIETPPEPDNINATAAFFCRNAVGTNGWSEHSKGLAVDINPVQNPYIKGDKTIPLNGVWNQSAPGTATANGVLVTAMAKAGMKWGGTWSSLKDYMHFSVSGR